MIRMALCACAAFLMTGCASVSVPARTSAQSVYAAEGTYAAALAVAVAYRGLPPCGSGAVLCSDAATLSKIRALDTAAWGSLELAENAVRTGATPGALAQDVAQAVTDVTAYQAFAQTLKVK